MAKVAIHTALEHTSLEPHLIYDGEENDFTHWVGCQQIPIIHWRSSLFRELTDLGRMNHPELTASLPGVFLRVDLPELGKKLGYDERVLYTDCDVFFTNEVVIPPPVAEPRYFAVAAESDRYQPAEMNSGVMWMHLPEMARQHSSFRSFALANLDNMSGAWDQELYKRFYRSPEGIPLWDELPCGLNWKAYWERNPSAQIVHFHGPKPFQRNYIDSHFSEIKHLTGGGYFELCHEWELLLKEANKRKRNRWVGK